MKVTLTAKSGADRISYNAAAVVGGLGVRQTPSVSTFSVLVGIIDPTFKQINDPYSGEDPATRELAQRASAWTRAGYIIKYFSEEPGPGEDRSFAARYQRALARDWADIEAIIRRIRDQDGNPIFPQQLIELKMRAQWLADP